MQPERSGRLLRFFLTLSVLLIICFVPLSQNIYQYNRKTVVVPRQNLQYASVKQKTVSQTFYVEGNISNLSVYFVAPNGSLYGDAMVTFQISQGEMQSTETVYASVLPRDGFYTLKGNNGWLKPGSATFSITGQGLPDETDIFCTISQTLCSGLPAASMDENSLGKPICIKYDVFKFDGYFWYDTILYSILLLSLVAISYLLIYKRRIVEKYNLLYIFSVFEIFLIVSIHIPIASLMGEPKSESVYEFWYKAKTMGLRSSMMSLMSGESLAWLERIMMGLTVKIIPAQYVFIMAQCMELIFIACVVSMPCLKTFSKFFSMEIRLLFCLFTGCWMFFRNAYLFWGVSYWATFFFIAFAFVDMSKLKWWQFWSAILLTVVLCVSRIYHIVLIPIAVLLLTLLGKERGRRFSIYCIVVAVASAFEVVYSMTAGASQHLGELQQALDIPLFFVNSLYYQLQIINSFFTGAVHPLGLLANMLYLVIFIGIIGFFVYTLLSKKYPRSIPAVLGGLGILSFGTIFINIITCASTSTVAFPHDYAATVNWAVNYYQDADFHFSYAYIALAWIFMTFVYILKEKVKVDLVPNISGQQSKLARNLLICIMAVSFVFLSSVNGKERQIIDELPTEWQSVAFATEKNSYYLAVNVVYGVANINMRHNSDGFVYGVDSTGNGYIWTPGGAGYDIDYKYSTAILGNISDLENRPLINITVRKSLLNFTVTYVAVLKNREGNVITRIPQVTSPERQWLVFIPDEPVYGVYEISFELTDGNPAFVQDGMQIGMSTLV